MKPIVSYLVKKLKLHWKKLTAINHGDLSYEEFVKLESKKYKKPNIEIAHNFRRHHQYHCTNECYRKR